MINVIPTDIDFIYNLKKALNMGVFNDPLAISDFIDILDHKLSENFEIDAIRSFSFLDDEYQFTIEIDKKYCDGNEKNKLQSAVSDSIMDFCSEYQDNIDDTLSKIGSKKDVSTFDDCILSKQISLLSEIAQKLDFNTMNGYCAVIKLY